MNIISYLAEGATAKTKDIGGPHSSILRLFAPPSKRFSIDTCIPEAMTHDSLFSEGCEYSVRKIKSLQAQKRPRMGPPKSVPPKPTCLSHLPAMSDGLLVKVQFPPGSLKKTATVKLAPEMTVADAVIEIAKAGHLSRPEQYLLYSASGTQRKWLTPAAKLADQGVTAQVRVEEVHNFGSLYFWPSLFATSTVVCRSVQCNALAILETQF